MCETHFVSGENYAFSALFFSLHVSFSTFLNTFLVFTWVKKTHLTYFVFGSNFRKNYGFSF